MTVYEIDNMKQQEERGLDKAALIIQVAGHAGWAEWWDDSKNCI